MAIFLSLIFAFNFYQTHVVLAKKRPTTSLENILMNLGTRIEAIKRVQEELERLDRRQSILKKITRHRSYSRLLHILAGIMNGETWLRQLAIESSKKKDANEENITRLKLTGFSHSNKELGDFVNRLSVEPAFKQVVLKYARETIMALSKRNKNEKVRIVEFEIECNL